MKPCEAEIGHPIHMHTHDTAGHPSADVLAGRRGKVCPNRRRGVSADVGRDQPNNLNTLVEALRFTIEEPRSAATRRNCHLWQGRSRVLPPVRKATLLPATGDLYDHEDAGGQYTNCFNQDRCTGVGDRGGRVPGLRGRQPIVR